MLTIPTGCTITHTFTAEDPSVLTGIRDLYVTYSQDGKVILEKTLADVVLAESDLIVPMSQSDTLLFDARKGIVSYQVRIAYLDGAADKTAVMHCSCDELLKEGVI